MGGGGDASDRRGGIDKNEMCCLKKQECDKAYKGASCKVRVLNGALTL